VGKCLKFNGGVVTSGLFEHEVRGHRGAPVTRITHNPYELDPALGLVGGGGFDFRFDLTPIVSALNIDGNPYGDQGAASPLWGSEFKKLLRRSYLHRAAAFGHTTSLPVETNRVDLDPDLKDAWGVPAIRTTFTEHPLDKKLYAWFQEKGVELLKAAGAVKTTSFPIGDDPGSSVHLLGTCRMGNDPKTSVVDKYHRAHDVPNLFIVSGASFVTSGRGQPTLTIQTLAFRAADHMSQMAKRGEI
jgi:choline dehydrogenase-like flavoprotein